jgi:MFS family permease
VQKFLQNFVFPREINLLFISIYFFATAYGINIVAFPTILTKHGVTAANIGIYFTCDVAGGIIMSFFLSKFVAHFGMTKALRITALTYAAAISIIYFCTNFLIWICIAFIMGACWFTYAISRQAWLNILVKSNERGIILGIYSMVGSAGFASGPLITNLVGADNYFSFVISAALVIASLLLMKPLQQKPQPQIQSDRISLIYFFKKNPRCFLGRFFLDFQTYLLLTFTVVFGIKIHLSYETAGLLITAYMASGFFDVFVGFLLKKYDPYKLINLGFAGALSCFILVIFFTEHYFALLAIYFIFGLFIACIYVSNFKITNDDYKKEKLIAANSTFQLIGSAGSFCGALTGGYFTEIFGTHGFPITMILSCVLYLTFFVIYEKKFISKN